MRKIALATLLALTTASAFAGFNGNGSTPSGYQGTTKTMSVKRALSAPDNSMVTLTGKIVQQIDDDEFLFSDGTGRIRVEIKHRVWNGLNVGPNDRVRIKGKLDNEPYERAEVEVYSIQKVR